MTRGIWMLEDLNTKMLLLLCRFVVLVVVERHHLKFIVSLLLFRKLCSCHLSFPLLGSLFDSLLFGFNLKVIMSCLVSLILMIYNVKYAVAMFYRR